MPGICEASTCSASARAAIRASCTFRGSAPVDSTGPWPPFCTTDATHIQLLHNGLPCCSRWQIHPSRKC